MKRLIYILCIPFILYSCKKEEKITPGFEIEGKIDKSQNSAIAKLFRIENKKAVPIDSTVIISNTFKLHGEVEQPDMYYITIEGFTGTIPILLENEVIKIEVYSDSLFASSISGGKETDYFNIYHDFIKNLRARNKKIEAEFPVAQQANDTLKMSALRLQYESLLKENQDYDLEYISTNNDATLSALILERNLNSKKFEFNKIKEIYTNFSDAVKKTRPGKAVAKYVEDNQKTAIGQPVPEFSGPTPDGKTIALNDIKGKVTIIDFWAAWCGPCRKENPNVVRIYEKYHDKGLEIIGVSLDGRPRQNGPKDAWIDAIEKDKLTWNHVSNLQYFNDPIAKEFNINAIPAIFIIDAEGTIVAKDLRGQALEDKIAELLN